MKKLVSVLVFLFIIGSAITCGPRKDAVKAQSACTPDGVVDYALEGPAGLTCYDCDKEVACPDKPVPVGPECADGFKFGVGTAQGPACFECKDGVPVQQPCPSS